MLVMVLFLVLSFHCWCHPRVRSWGLTMAAGAETPPYVCICCTRFGYGAALLVIPPDVDSLSTRWSSFFTEIFVTASMYIFFYWMVMPHIVRGDALHACHGALFGTLFSLLVSSHGTLLGSDDGSGCRNTTFVCILDVHVM